MRYINDSKATLILGSEILRAGRVSRDFTERDLESNPDLRAVIDSGRIKEFKGPPPAAKPTAKKDARYILDDARNDKPVVNPKTKTVEYIISDSDSIDTVHMADNTMAIAKDASGRPPADTIEDGFDARAMKNASEVMEDQMNKEHSDSSYDDEENLSDNEGEAPDSLDVDEAMANDFSRIVKSNGKSGAVVMTAHEGVEADLAQAVDEMNKVAGNNDEEVVTVNGAADGKLVDFFKSPFNSKKKMIAKETNMGTLKVIADKSGSDNIKNLVKQRMAELG